MTDHDDTFSQHMQDVKPLQTRDRVAIKKGDITRASQQARRIAAVDSSPKRDPNHLQTTGVQRVGPHDVVGFKRPGIQDGVFRKLRLGKYESEARLDLHRRTVEEARRQLFHFLQDCMAHDIRSVVILPGKGDRSEGDPAILKSYLVYWLEQIDDVQAYHTAQPQHGGTGVLYVLLRKSEKKKQEARERYSKGRL
ncbi:MULTISPECIES: DNA endonuclease SmrA [unclassified Oceanobacter]|uniref:DNA endonuclease SmrA n=1 Tax=unclassified Oceanobacter TaxID=2620260 RepID=UPI0026E21049|nr:MULTISPECIES: DNA endonuclease SmrA [unclassified Oceanobacter]MDO6680945.1 DNA endonuclease SmrA [Oceanobacter sp. 5_MG-2023]MDP2504706.1 DNA endonuclease SmrA [Oceanobacter sp. 3_MG-2023]MDP2546836.1 DNA endonuclease SmrA [Oceanobacter sp. 4_MG-2023]MDP2607663.1 DNA endonuclease SmrA [Oceanobacter sp. 1_MG-2023]MDP2611153.1 DNA endonuclease SmrA [Oceanobacter sp. 2_MG-2023]